MRRAVTNVIVAWITAFALDACSAPPAEPIVCGTGTQLIHGICIAPGTNCLSGTHASGNMCVPDAPPADPPSAWSRAVQVDTTHSWSAEPELTVTPQGDVYVASMVRDNDLRGVALFRSTDGGATFAALDERLPFDNSEGLGDVTVATMANGDIAWAWADYTASGLFNTRSNILVTVVHGDVGGAEPSFANVSAPHAAFTDRPWLALAPDGSLYLSWLAGDEISIFGEGNTFGANFAVIGTNASVIRRGTIVMPGTREGLFVNSPIAFLPGSEPIVPAYARTSDATGTPSDTIRLFSNSASDSTDIAIAPATRSNDFSFATQPIAVVDSHGVISVAYLQAPERRITPVLIRSTDSVHWSAPVAFPHTPLWSGDSKLPWITVDEHDRVHALWLDNENGAWIPFSSFTDDGERFAPAERVSDVTFTTDGSSDQFLGDFVSLAVRGGRRFAAWTDTRSGMSQVYFATSAAP